MRFSLSLGRILYCQYCNGIVRYSSSFSFDPYKILEIPPDATKETIKSAYFKLAKKYHPDRNPSDASAKLKFENVQNAYRYLMEHIAKTSDGKYIILCENSAILCSLSVFCLSSVCLPVCWY